MAVPIQRGAIRTNHFWIVARDYLVACPFILHRLGLCFNLEKPYWLTVPGNPDSTPPELEHARWLDNVTKIVVSRTLERIEWNNNTNTVLIKDNIVDEINKIKQQPGKDIWFLGSTMLAQTFMQLDLIDEYRLNINPVVLGTGKPLFADVTRQFPLKLLESKTLKSGVVSLRYEPERK